MRVLVAGFRTGKLNLKDIASWSERPDFTLGVMSRDETQFCTN